MKVYFLIGLCSLAIAVSGQSYIPPRNLQVTDNKTTNIIFPAQISSVDRGSERIVVQKSTGNILRVKADTAFTDTTNLTVITSDGKLYSFLVSYAVSPTFLNLDLGAGDQVTKDTALLALLQKVSSLKANLYGIRYSSGRVRLSLAGVYTDGERIICKLKVENTSALSFETGRLRSFVSGGTTGKRRSLQEEEITPLLVHPTESLARQKQSIVLHVIFPKAALGEGQCLQITLTEKDGERRLSISVPNRYILNAATIQ